VPTAGELLRYRVSYQDEDVVLMRDEEGREERNETVDDQERERET